MVLLDLLAAALVFWRVPYYLDWMQTGQPRRLLWAVRDGLAAGLAFALVAVLASMLFGGGEPTVTRSIGSVAIWFAVLGGGRQRPGALWWQCTHEAFLLSLKALIGWIPRT